MENLELQTRTKLDTGQRIAVGLLVCLTILLATVSFFQFKSNIFAHGKRIKTDQLLNLDPAEREEAQLLALKKVDTDGDGLMDYDELYVYRSSPYMRDTDSDAIADGEEVRRGSSPTCQEGKDCLFNTIAATANASSTAKTEVATDAAVQPQISQTDFDKLSASDLRDVLLESGIPADQLKQVSDEDLIKLVQQAQKDNSVATPTTNP